MNRTDKYEDIRAIADAVCNDTVTAEQTKQLEKLLSGNPQAQKFYHEYIEMHVQMLADSVPTMEVVRRRMQVDEVLIRPVGQQEYPEVNQVSPVLDGAIKLPTTHKSQLKKPAYLQWLVIISGLLSIMLAVIVFIFGLADSEDTNLAEIIDGRLSIVGAGSIHNNKLTSGVYYTEKTTQLTLKSGEQLSLAEQTEIKFYNDKEIELRTGKLSVDEAAGSYLVVSGPNFKVRSEGSTLTVDLTHELPQITTGKNTALIPARWRPNHFWSFNGLGDQAQDFAGNSAGIPSKGAVRVNGLVGSGAFQFDNTKDARINVGSGGGTAPATGSFSVIDGVTIEALIVPEYNGVTFPGRQHGEIDEIFRKDQDDKEHRMLLSFQNDKGKTMLKPEGDFDESLSFGLYLVGQGYHELKLPLDGKENRPTLAELKDGKAHHVVATYDVKSGLKAIYLDGQMLAYYQYPPGSKMLSGGSGIANIGNSPNATGHAGEAFKGIIDEVAFYDFALPEYMVNQHYQYFQQGRDYYGFKSNRDTLPKEIEIQLPAYQTIVLDPLTGLPATTKED
ncbi:LamG-like jellyroll fold domain-containing protein [Catenovulum adriaticum]|uniref:LamG domain-containing protein n=1 Tax=Catenovulum adriaticum TaxID=2984846 RepID=A0ABY7AT50_9ALTE|nr:LamG-like jellyroll fold domain-containing protein [Catenovulum sp. TS8]WAJ71695.1 LamG domain-containing protein [Catenovulum sp. TS8]